jgi:hypothetical protein
LCHFWGAYPKNKNLEEFEDEKIIGIFGNFGADFWSCGL